MNPVKQRRKATMRSIEVRLSPGRWGPVVDGSGRDEDGWREGSACWWAPEVEDMKEERRGGKGRESASGERHLWFGPRRREVVR
jgi:hypothetical protein